MKKIAVFALLVILLAACREEKTLEEPPEILYGQDICDECGMIINEARFAASYMTNTGKERRFDDIGGMLAYAEANQEDVYLYWVHDLNSEAWVNAHQAVFVLDQDLATPMGWGLAAFANAADAEAFVAANGGLITTFAALQEEIKTGALDPAAFSDHGHEGEKDHESAEHTNK